MALQIGKIRTSSIEMHLSCLLCSCDNHAYDMLSTQKGVKLSFTKTYITDFANTIDIVLFFHEQLRD